MGSGLALLLLALLLSVALAWFADGFFVRLLLDRAAARAADEVQLGLLDRITAADFITVGEFATPLSTEHLDDLALRLDPVVARLRANGSGILRVNLIGRDGRIVYSDLAAIRGRMIPLGDRPELETALSGGIGTDETALGGEENADLRAGYTRALEVYVPVLLDGQVAGAYEIYEDIGQLRSARALVWGGLLTCWYLAGIVWTMRRIRARRVEAQPAADPRLTAEPREAVFETSTRVNAERDLRVRLTPREIDVLRLMATSHSNRDIAEQLGVSQETVRTHVKRILHKLDQPDRTQAVLAALREGLLDLP